MPRESSLVTQDTSRRRRRVLFFDHTAVLSGGELALLSLVTALDRSVVDPVVLLGAQGPLTAKLQAIAEVHTLELDARVESTRKDEMGLATVISPAKLLLSLRYIVRLASLFQELRADLIHTNSLKSDLLGGIAAKLAGLPLIWHVRDRIESSYLPSKVVWAFRRLCRIFPDRIIANSNATLETLHLPEGKPAYVIPSGFDVHRFVHAGSGSEPLATALAHSHPILVGLVGRISPWKGQEVFIHAAERVHSSFPTARFLIIGAPLFGETAFAESLHELVADRGLENVVAFLGFQEDVASAIGRLHILVHASTIPEPLGQVIAQGMAAQKPVVATIGGGPSEIVTDRVTGLMVPPGDDAAMASAILEILRDPAAAEAMALRGQQFATSRFSELSVARAVEAVYDDLLS